MKLDTLEALLQDQLRDLYSAEVQLTKALPKMAKKAGNEQLREAFQAHLEETRGHAEALQQIGEQLGFRLGGKKCHAMEGLIEEGKEMLEQDGAEPVIDLGLIAAAQRVEHYEISGYGTARSLANHLGLRDVADALQRILDEEGETDKKLTELSIDVVLPSCAVDEGGAAEEQEKADEDRAASAGASRSASRSRAGSAGRGGTATRTGKSSTPGRAASSRR